MGADGAHNGSLLAHDDVAAVSALPDHVAVSGEYEAALDVGDELSVSLLVLLLDSADFFKEQSDGGEALFSRFLGEVCVHVRPLEVLAVGGVRQIDDSFGDLAVVEELEPDLCVLFFIYPCLIMRSCESIYFNSIFRGMWI